MFQKIIAVAQTSFRRKNLTPIALRQKVFSYIHIFNLSLVNCVIRLYPLLYRNIGRLNSSAKIKKQYLSASKNWSSGETSAILSILAETDMNIRSGGTLLENTLLEKALYEIIIKKGSSSAVCDFSI